MLGSETKPSKFQGKITENTIQRVDETPQLGDNQMSNHGDLHQDDCDT